MKGILYELYRYAICEPRVDEWNAPPLNASNLNDISNALQAVNITQEERTTLGAEATDTLGQILAALKNAGDETSQSVEQLQQTISSIQSQIGTNKYQTGSYVGNGQSTLTLNFDFEPKFYFASYKQDQTNMKRVVYMCYMYNSNFAFIFDNNGGTVQYLREGSTSTKIVLDDDEIEFILNVNGETVYYIVFG